MIEFSDIGALRCRGKHQHSFQDALNGCSSSNLPSCPICDKYEGINVGPLLAYLAYEISFSVDLSKKGRKGIDGADRLFARRILHVPARHWARDWRALARRILNTSLSHSTLAQQGRRKNRVPTGPKKECTRKEKEMGRPRSQHFVLESRDIEIVTRS